LIIDITGIINLAGLKRYHKNRVANNHQQMTV